MSERFDLQSEFEPTGDQPRAINELVEGLQRGDPYQTLLGATGTGKSVGYDDPVFVVEGEGAQVQPIGPLVDRYFAEAHPEDVQRDGDSEVLPLPPGRVQTLALDPATGEATLHDVSAFTRHAPTASMYRVATGCGRSITLTGDHNLWVLRDGRLQLIETADARPTDYLPVPDALPEPPQAQQEVDLLHALRGTRQRVYAKDAVLALAEAEGPGAVAVPLREAGVAQPYVVLHAMRNGTGGLSQKVYRHLRRSTPLLGRDARIGGKRHRLPTRLRLTPRTLRLLGYYVAEGAHTRNYVLLANYDAAIREDIEQALEALNLTFTVRSSSDYQIGSSALADVLERWCGTSSRTKRLPPFWARLANEDLAQLLRAYFDGDGTVGHASDVTATTASEELASDLTYALLRFGIWARIRTKTKRATNSQHEGGTYYEVVVSGQDNLHRFAEQIGFGLERKQERLEAALHRRGNTNVDVVPVSPEDLRELRTKLRLRQRDVAAFGGVSRGAVQLYEAGKRRPGRAALRAIVRGLEATAREQGLADVAWWERLRAVEALCGVRWTPVAAVEPVAYEHDYVYDFTVPGPETFLAGRGGFFVHNTFSLSNVVAEVNRPTLVMSHNKTLAAQLYAELKQFFPNNAVEFFISYYDYYQPEAYIVSSDTYIEKDMAINDRIDRLRLRATSSLVSGRQDVIVVASVSCIYGLGSPEEYKKQIVQVREGQTVERNAFLHQLINIFYVRNDIEFEPGAFRVRGDVVDIFPAYAEDYAYRIAFWGDEVEEISIIDPISGNKRRGEELVTIYPAKIFVTPEDQLERAIQNIEEELRWRLAVLHDEGKMLEAQRLEQRTRFDIEMMKELGYCSGIENYSRHLIGRKPGERPYCLFDYFPDDYLLVVDESHVTLPQVRAMYNGDRARKLNLVEHGFRLPSALDNRPMTFEEFEAQHNQVIYASATPADYELEQCGGVFVEQIIRPTGVPDPRVEVRPIDGQIDDLLEECRKRVENGHRVLVTTLTKRMAEDLSEYLDSFGVRVRYMHSDIDALERVDILRGLRLGDFDVLVGVNLLREGLDLPEVSLVAILDADKEGFLRSERSLIQTAGRAARNAEGLIVLYADKITDSMRRMMDETERRREIQLAYNEEHDITPKTVYKSREAIMRGTVIAEEKRSSELGPASYYAGPDPGTVVADPVVKYLTPEQKGDLVEQMQREMAEAAEALEYERAAELRDQIEALKKDLAGEG